MSLTEGDEVTPIVFWLGKTLVNVQINIVLGVTVHLRPRAVRSLERKMTRQP